MMTTKSRENRARRTATRRGLRLSKSPRRDPCAVDYGLCALLDNKGTAINPALAAWGYIHSWTLDQIEAYLAGRPK